MWKVSLKMAGSEPGCHIRSCFRNRQATSVQKLRAEHGGPGTILSGNSEGSPGMAISTAPYKFLWIPVIATIRAKRSTPMVAEFRIAFWAYPSNVLVKPFFSPIQLTAQGKEWISIVPPTNAILSAVPANEVSPVKSGSTSASNTTEEPKWVGHTQTELATKEDLIAFKQTLDKSIATIEQNAAETNLLDISLPGVSVLYVLRLGKPIAGRNNFIFDSGEGTDKNRFSVFLDAEENLCCRVLDRDSKQFTVKTSPALDTFDIGNLIFLACEYGSTDRFSFVRIIINGKQVAEMHQDTPIIISKPLTSYGWFLGADLNGTNGGVFGAICLLWRT